MNTKTGTHLLMAKEVAAILRVKPARVYDLARKGLIPSVCIGERQIRFQWASLQEWIARGGSIDKR
jgi:excisionase family DNA binding protein